MQNQSALFLGTDGVVSTLTIHSIITRNEKLVHHSQRKTSDHIARDPDAFFKPHQGHLVGLVDGELLQGHTEFLLLLSSCKSYVWSKEMCLLHALNIGEVEL
jgi:hypothetical protein